MYRGLSPEAFPGKLTQNACGYQVQLSLDCPWNCGICIPFMGGSKKIVVLRLHGLNHKIFLLQIGRSPDAHLGFLPTSI